MPSPLPLPPAGTVIRVSSSPSRTVVSKTPTKNSSAETVRSPSRFATVIVASSATRSGGKWLVGSFTQMFPPSVPRLRTWTSATVAATSARIGRVTSTSEERISDVSVVIGADLERRARDGDRAELVETGRGRRAHPGTPPVASSRSGASGPRRGHGLRRARRGARPPPRQCPAARRKPLAAA